MALTGKKKLFADAVLGGKSNKDAAIAAGYSAKTASAAGSRLVKDRDVVDYLAAMRKSPAEGDGRTPSALNFDLSKALQFSDPKPFLLAAMNDSEIEPKLRIDAAKALMPFVHSKVAEAGKKDARADAAKKAGAGKFAAATPPKLVVNNGR